MPEEALVWGLLLASLTNVLCLRMDQRIAGLAKRYGWRYTRYADDLTFSLPADHEGAPKLGTLIGLVKRIVASEGFTIHPDKTRVWRKGRRQEVTGLVVNKKVSVSRQLLRRFRATVFQIERDGPEGKRWGSSRNVLASLHGFANFIAMVDAAKGRPLRERVHALLQNHAPDLRRRRAP